MDTNDSLLGFALMGLLNQQPMSGYDLRKVFAQTAMGNFSDSPGAIYPALGRLEKRGLVRGTVEESSSLRKRRVFKVTTKGLTQFKAWLKRPVTRDDVMRRIEEAARYFPIENLALSPQCGFASTMEGNNLTEEQQWAKLKLVVDVARRVWG